MAHPTSEGEDVFMTQSVLIIGAGPVGLTLAIELARYAIPVRIVEKMAQRTDKSKALVLWNNPGTTRSPAGRFGAFYRSRLQGARS